MARGATELRVGRGQARPAVNHAGTSDVGFLENPSPNSFQSASASFRAGCEAEEVTITLGDLAPQAAGYAPNGSIPKKCVGIATMALGAVQLERLGDEEHEVIAYVDNIELGRRRWW